MFILIHNSQSSYYSTL